MSFVVNPYSDIWTPAVLNPEFWVDATDPYTITESAGSVSQWDDKSKNGNDLTQSTGAKQPTTGTRQYNGNNVIDFDPGTGDGEYIDATSITALPNTTWDIFVMYKRDRTSENDYLLTFNDSGSGQIRGNRFGDISLDGSLDSGSGFNTGGNPSDTDPHIWNARMDGSTGNYLFIDGAQVDVDTSPVGAISVDSYLRMGANAFGGDTHDGWIGEVIVFSYLSDANRELVEGYLAWKWGGA